MRSVWFSGPMGLLCTLTKNFTFLSQVKPSLIFFLLSPLWRWVPIVWRLCQPSIHASAAHSYQNCTELAGSIGWTGNRTVNRDGLIKIPEMHMNRIEPAEPAGILKNHWTGRYLVNRPVFEKSKKNTNIFKKTQIFSGIVVFNFYFLCFLILILVFYLASNF